MLSKYNQSTTIPHKETRKTFKKYKAEQITRADLKKLRESNSVSSEDVPVPEPPKKATPASENYLSKIMSQLEKEDRDNSEEK